MVLSTCSSRGIVGKAVGVLVDVLVGVGASVGVRVGTGVSGGGTDILVDTGMPGDGAGQLAQGCWEMVLVYQ